jgi:hypothetical protein
MDISSEMIRAAASRKFQETLGRPPTPHELEELVLLIIELHGIMLEEEIAVRDGKVAIVKRSAGK